MQFRHGDVFLQAIETLPEGVVALPHLRLAEGEATGHAHVLESSREIAPEDGPMLFEWDGQLYFRTGAKPTAVTHEEHARIEIPPGVYSVTIQREYVPGELPRTAWD